MSHPPLPPHHNAGTSQDTMEAVEAEPGRENAWTRDEIAQAGCSLYDLADVYARCEAARQYPISQLAFKLCVKWGTYELGLKSDLLPLNVTREEIAETWGCSPPDAEAPNRRTYVPILVGRNPRTGGFQKVITRTGGSFVVGVDEAPCRVWEFDEAAQRNVRRDMRDYITERARLDGKHHETGEPFEESGGGYAAPAPGRYGQESGGRWGQDSGGGFLLEPPAPAAPAALPPGARGPNGEDLYHPTLGWMNSATRNLQLQNAPRPVDPDTAALREELRLLRQREAERDEREKREREERAAREERDRVKQEQTEREKREKDRHDALMAQMAAQTAAITAALTAQRPAEPAPREKSESTGQIVAAVVAAIGTAAAPLVTVWQASQTSASAEAQRRHDLELKDRDAAHRERLAELKLREAAAQRPTGPDPALAVLQTSMDSMRSAIARMRETPRDAVAKDTLLERIKEFQSLRNVLKINDGAAAVQSAVDAVTEEDPTIALVDKIAERMEGPLTVVANYVTKRMENNDKREEADKSKARRGGWVSGPNGTLQSALRVRLASGQEVEVPDDTVMLPNGAMVPLAAYPAFVAQLAPAPQFQQAPPFAPAPQFQQVPPFAEPVPVPDFPPQFQQAPMQVLETPQEPAESTTAPLSAPEATEAPASSAAEPVEGETGSGDDEIAPFVPG